MKVSAWICGALLALGVCVPLESAPQAQKAANVERLRKLYADEWEYQLSHHPELATYVGDQRFNDRLSDYSADEQRREREHAQKLLETIRVISADGLSGQEITTRKMMIAQIELGLESDRLKEWEMPVSQMSGAHLDLAALPSQISFTTREDYQNYISRLHQMPRVLDQVTEVMRMGMREHLMQPRFLLEQVGTQAREISEYTAEKSPFFAPFAHAPPTVEAKDADRLRTLALKEITGGVLPAYARFARFVSETYAPQGRSEPGIWSLPDGTARYMQNIHEHVQTARTPDQIFDEGMRQVEEIQKQMVALAKREGFADQKAFNASIHAGRTHYASSGRQLLDLYEHYEDQMRKRLLEVVPAVPSLALEVVPMDSFRAPSAVPADYSPGSAAGPRPGRVNVNLYQPEQRLLLNVEAIAYHEGVPGHHLQFSFAEQLGDLPAFRRYASYDAYSEGWALYAEQLGKELGFYEDPYSEYGRLQNEMWRSVRLVVDTGVHAKHWSRQQMVDFFQSHTEMDAQSINTEVDRYISWPGQALAYRLGQMKILELRALAQKRLGPKYDIKAFHQQVLSMGPVPLDVLDDGIQRWISELDSGRK